MPLNPKLHAKIFQSAQFLNAGIWRLRAQELNPRQCFWITQLRIILLAIRRFSQDKCELRASALTFYSLLSFIPVVALVFGVAKGFGLEKMLQTQILANLEGQPEVADKVLDFARNLLENTKGGAIAGVGVVVLFWSVVKVLGNIETAFNDIWGIQRGRSLGRKLADYLSVVMISPVLLITASSITVLLTAEIETMIERLSFLGYAAGIIIFLLRLLPYAMIWFLFTFMYVFMPNTKVRIKSGLWGGIVAGTIYQAAQFAYIKFQIGVSSYGAIYGSFAALPLFFAWLQLSWLIVLLGAEISFACQNVGAFEYAADCERLSHRFKRLVALIVTHQCVKDFLQGQTPPVAEKLAKTLEIPIRLVRSTLFELTEAKILSEVCPGEGADIAYQPGCRIDDLTVNKVLLTLDRQGLDAVPIAESKQLDRLRDTLREIDALNEKSPANLKLQEL
jgi:membrane protein